MDISVALGGGGARGLAHIGVLQVLEREGFIIRAIAGTSMGGVIAAMYAAGYSPDEMVDTASETPPMGLLRARPDGAGLIGLGRVAEFMKKGIGDRTFADMRIPLALTATDLEMGREVVITQGNVVDGILATIALPGIFSPKIQGDTRLVDGGMVDPVPVRPARELFPAAPVVAVALSPKPEEWGTKRSPSPLGTLPVLDMFSRLRPGQALNVFLRALEISARSMTELHLQVDKPDVVIRPAVSHIGLLQQAPVSEAADLGAKATEEALPELRALFTPSRRLARQVRGLFGR
jgi:NTE family protein